MKKNNRKFKTQLLLILTLVVNLATAVEIQPTTIKELSISSNYVIVVPRKIDVAPSCSLVNNGFLLDNKHPMFEELYSMFLTARASNLVITIDFVGIRDDFCKIEAARL